MSTLLTYEYKCEFCDYTEKNETRVSLMANAPNPCPPRFWRVFEDSLICWKHDLDLVVDGKKVIEIAAREHGW